MVRSIRNQARNRVRTRRAGFARGVVLALTTALSTMVGCLGPGEIGDVGGAGADPGSGSRDTSSGGDVPDSPDSPDSPDAPDPTIPAALSGWCSDQAEGFSFFVTGMDALWALSDSAPGDLSAGFGGDFGGLAGADGICQSIGAATGHGDQTWRAFLSATDDGAGHPVHAIERIGQGPWTDANGRLVASGIDGLLDLRPDGEPQSVEDLPNECGVPLSALGDAHDVITGSTEDGRLFSQDPESTCLDWTSSDESVGAGSPGGGLLRNGHSFPRPGSTGDRGVHWISDHSLQGCGKGANLLQTKPGEGPATVGQTGGYGAIYCFAL